MASLYLKGEWYGVLFTDTRRSPRRKKHALRTRDLKTATRLLHRLEDAYALGRFDPWTQDPFTYDKPVPPPAPSEPMTLTKAVEFFLASRSGTREATRQAYNDALRPLVAVLGPSLPVASLDTPALLRWFGGLTCGAQSKASYLARVRTFCTFLVSIGALDSNPASRIPKGRVPDKLASKCMTEAHLAAFVRAVDHRATPYLADLAVVSFDLALRRSEAAAMRVGWVDLDRGLLRVASDGAFTTKTGMAVVKPIPPRSLAILRARCEGRPASHPVFVNQRGKPIGCVRRLTRTWKVVAERAGLPETITPHAARHGGLSKLVAAGASVEAARRFAGHTTPTMTLRYLHLHDDGYFDQIRSAQR